MDVYSLDPWLALRTKSRHEHVVERSLRQRDIINYLPKRCVTRRSKQGARSVELPLFPGYVFVKPRLNQYESIHYVRGSLGLVVSCGKPATLPERDMASVRALVDSGVVLDNGDELIPGKRVRIVDGPFTGVEGELIQTKRRHALVINIGLVGRSIRVEVDRDLLKIV